MSELPIESAGPAEPEVRIWSPLAVGVYAIVLAYPCSLMLAVRNWKAMGQHDRIRPHLLGAALLSVPLIILIYMQAKAGRFFALGVNIATFIYLRDKLRSDIAEFQRLHPSAEVRRRPWYSAIGWALLALFLFFLLVIPIGLTLDALGIAE